jgi:hypothetical protein
MSEGRFVLSAALLRFPATNDFIATLLFGAHHLKRKASPGKFSSSTLHLILLWYVQKNRGSGEPRFLVDMFLVVVTRR